MGKFYARRFFDTWDIIKVNVWNEYIKVDALTFDPNFGFGFIRVFKTKKEFLKHFPKEDPIVLYRTTNNKKK